MANLVLLQAVPMGFYESPYKIAVILLFSIFWWRLLSWIDKDTVVARLPRELVCLVAVGIYILGFILLLAMPTFGIAFSVFLLLMVVTAGAYLGIRHSRVGLHDLIEQVKGLKNFKFTSARPGKKGKDDDLDSLPGLVALATKDGKPIAQPADESPDRASYDMLQLMLTEPLRRNMERLDLVAIEGGFMAQYWVDGVIYNGAQINRASAASMITYLKKLAKMDLNEKRKPQTGTLQAAAEGARHKVQVNTAGSTSGESLRLVVDAGKRHTQRLAETGMAEDQLEQIRAAVREPGGIVLVAVPKGQGLTTLLYAILREHDAFLTHIHSIERDAALDLEGITQNKLAHSASQADELQSVQWVAAQQPDTVMISEVQSPKSARELINLAADNRRVYVGMRSASAIDAINDFRTLVGDDAAVMKNLRMVIAGRVLRKLCEACKQPYQPDQDTLRKLNLDHARSQQFYQARTQQMVDNRGRPLICNFCQELRYRGRTGVYEVMDITDDIRKAILSNASVTQLRGVFRKLRGRFVQERAMDMVEQGVTSIQEVLRSMRGQEHDSRTATHSGSAAGTAAPSNTAAGKSPGGTGSGTSINAKTGPTPAPPNPKTPRSGPPRPQH